LLLCNACAKQKKVPKTFAVPCLVVDPAATTETSLAENTIRVAMHAADQFIAFHDLVVQTGWASMMWLRASVLPLCSFGNA
jgi:ParB family transcriptional regulator, chromosome partitioning protein